MDNRQSYLSLVVSKLMCSTDSTFRIRASTGPKTIIKLILSPMDSFIPHRSSKGWEASNRYDHPSPYFNRELNINQAAGNERMRPARAFNRWFFIWIFIIFVFSSVNNQVVSIKKV